MFMNDKKYNLKKWDFGNIIVITIKQIYVWHYITNKELICR